MFNFGLKSNLSQTAHHPWCRRTITNLDRDPEQEKYVYLISGEMWLHTYFFIIQHEKYQISKNTNSIWSLDY